MRVSRSMRDTAYHAMQAKERLINELQRDPTIEEIAKELDLPKETVVLAMESIVEPVSLYEPVYSDGGDTIYVMDQIGDQNSDDSWVDEILLRQSISNLNPREKKILHLRFMEGKTQMEVARKSAFRRRRFPGWKKELSAKSKTRRVDAARGAC